MLNGHRLKIILKYLLLYKHNRVAVITREEFRWQFTEKKKKALKSGQHAETCGLLRTMLCKCIRGPLTPLRRRDLSGRDVARL